VTETFQTRIVRGTEAFGREFAARLRTGDCVALIGPLGAGKTALVRGIAEGLGVADRRAVSSPTFVLVQEYAGRIPVYHVDLYRLGRPAEANRGGTAPAGATGIPAGAAGVRSGAAAASPEAAAELAALGLDEMLASGVVLIEWADRAGGALPRPRWQIEIEPASERRRRFRLARIE
jgi:tRNA threonylcarbamoyladenosine biosynthesis protein TsaE